MATSSRMSSRAVAVAILGAATLVSVVLWRTVDSQPPQPPPPAVVAVTYPVAVGDVYSLGNMRLANPDRLTMEVVSVTPNMSDNLEMVGVAAAVVRPDLSPALGGPGFPYGEPGLLRYEAVLGRVFAAEEFRQVPPESPDVLDLMIGVRLLDGDVGAVNGITVVFQVGDDLRTEYFPFAMIVRGETFELNSVGLSPEQKDDILRQLGLLADG